MAELQACKTPDVSHIHEEMFARLLESLIGGGIGGMSNFKETALFALLQEHLMDKTGIAEYDMYNLK